MNAVVWPPPGSLSEIPHEQCRCEPDGRTTISYTPSDLRADNTRPWHKHTLPRRKGTKR